MAQSIHDSVPDSEVERFRDDLENGRKDAFVRTGDIQVCSVCAQENSHNGLVAARFGCFTPASLSSGCGACGGRLIDPSQNGGARFRGLSVGCTRDRHVRLGVHAAINAKVGEQWRNDMSDEDWNLWRDVDAMRRFIDPSQRINISWPNWNSRYCRKRFGKVEDWKDRGYDHRNALYAQREVCAQ
jgi:hypothetical protein